MSDTRLSQLWEPGLGHSQVLPRMRSSLKLVAGEPRFASPKDYTPRHLADRILAAKATLEGERKQVTVLFADITGSTTAIQRRDRSSSTRCSNA
jgi:class 3 adenylate cyclase